MRKAQPRYDRPWTRLMQESARDQALRIPPDPTTHYLIAADNGKCISQAHFIVCKDSVRVVALIGATQYIDRDMSLDEARVTYKDLKGRGWVVPVKTKPLTTTVLRYHIYD